MKKMRGFCLCGVERKDSRRKRKEDSSGALTETVNTKPQTFLAKLSASIVTSRMADYEDDNMSDEGFPGVSIMCALCMLNSTS